MNPHTTNWKIWLYRLSVIVVCGLMLVSFLMPWWTTRISGTSNYICIYGYGLRHNLQDLRNYILSDETPISQIVLAWTYMTISISLIILSLWLKGNAGKWLMGVIGLIYLVYALLAIFVVVTGRLEELGLTLRGWSSFKGEEGAGDLYSSLRFGLYLAYITGTLCIILAMLRDIIMGKRKIPLLFFMPPSLKSD
jgi:hypothetical protein